MKNNSPFLQKKTSLITPHLDPMLGSKQEIAKQTNVREKFKADMSDWSKRMAAKKLKPDLSPSKLQDVDKNVVGPA